MWNYIKTMSSFVMWVLIAALCAYVYLSISTCNNYKHDVNSLKAAIKNEKDSTRHYRNENNILISQAKATELDYKQVEYLYGDTLAKVAKKLADISGKYEQIKAKQIKQITTIDIKASGSVLAKKDTVTTYVHDTLYKVEGFYPYTDSLINGLITVYAEGFAKLDYSVTIPAITIVDVWERKHHFWFIKWGKKQAYVKAYCDDERVQVKDIKTLLIRKDKM